MWPQKNYKKTVLQIIIHHCQKPLDYFNNCEHFESLFYNSDYLISFYQLNSLCWILLLSLLSTFGMFNSVTGKWWGRQLYSRCCKCLLNSQREASTLCNLQSVSGPVVAILFNIVLQLLKALSLTNPHRKMSGRMKSRDRGGERQHSIMCSTENFCSKAILVFTVWTITPACQNQQSFSFPSNREINWVTRFWCHWTSHTNLQWMLNASWTATSDLDVK